MKIRPISRVMTATALTNPDPSFVSVCTGPANQTPFHAVRSDDSINAADKPETDMKIKRSKAASAVVIAQKGHSVMQFAFDKNVFKTAEDVTTWLTEGGYEQTEMTETAKAFEVSDASGTRFEVGSTEVIRNAVPGVTAYIGKLANATDEDQIVEDVAEPAAEGTSEVTQKTEGGRPEVAARTRVRSGEEPTPAAVEPEPEPAEPVAEPTAEPAPVAKTEGESEEGVGGVQPVAGEEVVIEPELAQKIADILAANPITAQRGVGCYSITRVAELISSLRYIISDADYDDLDGPTVTNLKSSAKSALSALVSMVSQYSTEMTEVFRKDVEASQVQRSAEEPAPEPEAPAVEAEPTEPTAALDAATVARMIAEAVTPVKEEAAAATQRATEAEAAASEANARAETAERDLAERVEADENRTQSRKAADDLDAPVSTTKTSAEADAPLAKRSRAAGRMLESFGSRHAR